MSVPLPSRNQKITDVGIEKKKKILSKLIAVATTLGTRIRLYGESVNTATYDKPVAITPGGLLGPEKYGYVRLDRQTPYPLPFMDS